MYDMNITWCFRKKIDLNFSEHKLAVEVDEKEQPERPKTNEEEREKNSKDQLGCKIIRINSDAEDYEIFVEIGKIHNHIIESTKKFLIEKILNQSV